MYNLNIYGPTGLPRADIDENEIAKLSQEQQTAYFNVISSFTETTEADAAFVECEKAKRRAITDLKKKMDAHENSAPKRSFYDEWKKVVAKIPEPAPDPEVAKKVAASLRAVEKANDHLEACELAEKAARTVRNEKRQVFALAVMAWSRVDGCPKSTADLIRARSETERKIALENIANGLPPDFAVAQASTVGDSHIDRFKAGQGKGHSANFGYNRNAMRGAIVGQPKVPSEG
jgi:hypothetical protein